MSSKDRKSVPLGTFGVSHPPPPPDEPEAATPPASTPPERRSTKSTLVGHPAVPAGSLAPSVPPPAPAATSVAPGSLAPGGRRSSAPNTLLGHPRPSEPNAAPGTYLAPPKWQGARAYEGDVQPELQVGRGSRPSDEIEPERAVSTAPSVEVGTADAGRLPAEEADGAAPGPNLDDSIQRMLDEQAAVPLEVDESAAPDIELSASDIEVQSVLAAARPKPVTSTPPPTPTGAISSKLPRGRADEIADIPLEGGPALSPSVSFAPAEVASEPPDDSNPGLGVLVVAAMAVIGVGGWLLTQGTYQRPQAPVAAPAAATAAAPTPAPAVPPPAAVTPAPAAPALTAPAPAPAAPTSPAVAAPAAKPAPSVAPAAKPAPPARRTAPRAERRPAYPLPPAPAPSAPAPAAAEEPVLKPVDAYPTTPAAANPAPAKAPAVKPELLPDAPSRADVVAALDAVRAQVMACAPGQRGVAEVDITVLSSGQVSHAVVRGDFAGTPEGSCIARAVRGAAFGPFKQPRFRVVYPFSL